MSEGNATIKAVISGDTLILQGRAANGPPPERSLSLSSLQAPKVARGPNSPEEPYGWQSREFLRKLAVGYPVTFKVDYSVAAINREFGTVTLNGESLARSVVREGWAKVRQGREGEQSPELSELQALETQAQAEKKGCYAVGNGNNSTRDVKWSDYSSEALLESLKGKPTKMIIEYVRDGASFKAIIPESHYYINLSLAGIQAPRVNMPTKTGGGETKPAEPHALEARYFTETRLLQRDVDVVVGGIDKYGSFYGVILHPKGNISLELLKQGLARVVDYSIDFTTRDNAVQYRIAERAAKQSKLRIWRGYTPPQISGSKEYSATVIEIINGDTIVVKIDTPSESIGEERKLSLSSLRAPRPGNPRAGSAGEPWAAEAKESLRQRLIGRSVTVVVDYEREIPQGEKKEKRTFTSLYSGKGNKKKSIAEAIVADGFATVMRHRPDEDRAENYDDLIAAEAVAKASRKGLHAGESPAPSRVTDLSFDAKKARSYLPSLQRESDIRAVVEVVFSGSRFKLHIPSESCSIVMALSSLRTPNPTRAAAADSQGSGPAARGRAGDPFGNEAKAFTRQHVLQRTVEVGLSDMDKNGVALGTLTVIGPGGDKTPYGLGLVRQGLAHIDEYGAGALQPAFVNELKRAQQAAKEEKKGVWSVEEEKTEEDVVTTVTDQAIDVRVCEIVDGVRFYFHALKEDGIGKVTEKMKALTQAEGTTAKLPFQPRKGNVLAALFDDGSGPLWNRARVEEKLANGSFKVFFLDYGNRAIIPASKLRSLDASYTAMPAQAKEATLAFLRAPRLDDEHGEAAAMAFSRLAWGKTLQAKIYARDGSASMLTLRDVDPETGKKTVNQALCEEGLVRVSKTAERLAKRLAPAAMELVDDLKEAQNVARKARLGIWRFGDVGDSDDEHNF